MMMMLQVLLLLLLCPITVVYGQIQMLGGQYTTSASTNDQQEEIQSLLDLALDAAAMKETSNFDAKLSIYQNGRNNNNGGDR